MDATGLASPDQDRNRKDVTSGQHPKHKEPDV